MAASLSSLSGLRAPCPPGDGGSRPAQQRPDLDMLLKVFMVGEPLESVFPGCVKRSIIPDRGRQGQDALSNLKTLFTAASPEVIPKYMDQFTGFLVVQTNHPRVVRLLSFLAELVEDGTLSHRVVCESLLKHLDADNAMVWRESLFLVMKIISNVDYKGCRELMKVLLTKFDRLPPILPEKQVPSLKYGQQLLAMILDRAAALLPAYFAHDEVRRHYPDEQHSPHWILCDVIGKLQSSMRDTANLVSGVVQAHLRPVLGVSNMSITTWRLDPVKYCCALKGLLPYRESLLQPQDDLMFHVISQPNSRDAVHSILGMNRQQLQPNIMVEKALVMLGVVAMEMSETLSEEDQRLFMAWSHFASQLVFFYFLHLVNIGSVMVKLRAKLSQTPYRKGRGWLMWSLLHFVTSTIGGKNNQTQVIFETEFVPILNLFYLLYQDKERLLPPDTGKPSSVHETSIASIWMVYSNRSQADNVPLPRSFPYVLSKHMDWIQEQSKSLPSAATVTSQYTVPLLLNVYSNNTEISAKLLGILLEAMLDTSCGATPNPIPIPIPALNILAMHAKIRLMEKIKVHLMRVAESSKQPPSADTPSISHALLETYSKLLAWLGTRNFQSQLIPAVFKSQAWGVLHALVEIISYRVHLQLQFSFRFQLLQQLHTVASVSIIPNQLFVSAENATLRLIRGLNSPEFLLQLAKGFASDPKPLLSLESEEINRVFLMVIAQALHISNLDTVNWLEPFMRGVLSSTPNKWAETSLSFFPQAIRQFCATPSPADYKKHLLSKVDEDVRKFKSKSNEAEIVKIFTETDSSAVFLCVLWKILFETGTVNPVWAKVAQETQPKKQAAYLRSLVDYIVFTLNPPDSSPNRFNTVMLYVRELIWKYNFFSLDRLILCMVLRGYETREAELCLTLIHCLLLQTPEFTERVAALVKEVPADYWSHLDWDSRHTNYLSQFPESFQPSVPGAVLNKPPPSPMYFGNLCLRFLPVLDLVIQRILEVPEMASQSLEKLLDQYGPLYKFHDHPILYLYTTLHYYERTFAGRPAWKRKLVSTVMGAQQSVHTLDWYFSSEFTEYLSSPENAGSWSPPPRYYSRLLERVVEGLQPFSSSVPACDWRFSEFSGPVSFTLHCCCVELMALPHSGKTIARGALEALYMRLDEVKEGGEKDVLLWIGTLGLLFVSLPESFHVVILDQLLVTLRDIREFSPSSLHALSPGNRTGCLLLVAHAYWHHANMGALAGLPQWMQTNLRPVVKNEAQLLYVCHLIGPLLHRLTNEKPKALLEVVMELYHLLQAVDRHQGGRLESSNVIVDLLYHIKYMHIGDNRKEAIERVVSSLTPDLRHRLRFLVPHPADRPQTTGPANSVPLPLTTTISGSPSEPMQL